jgi:hypothetical protein
MNFMAAPPGVNRAETFRTRLYNPRHVNKMDIPCGYVFLLVYYSVSGTAVTNLQDLYILYPKFLFLLLFISFNDTNRHFVM